MTITLNLNLLQINNKSSTHSDFKIPAATKSRHSTTSAAQASLLIISTMLIKNLRPEFRDKKTPPNSS